MVLLPSAAFSVSPDPDLPPIQAIPEFQKTKAVLLAEDLFQYEYEAPALLDAIVEAGAEAWIVTENKAAQKDILSKISTLAPKAKGRVRAFVIPHGNIWLRDYGPFPVATRDANGGLKLALLDLKFDGAATAMDRFPRAVGKTLGLPVERVPVAIDGGDFLTSGEFCFTSTGDLQQPKEVQAAKARLGCRELVVLKDPPHPHLDMWAKIVNEHVVLVNQLDERTLAQVQALFGNIPDDIKSLARSLDAKAKEWSRYLKVVRLPMPMPFRRTFRTYSNALLVNGTAIVPSYEHFGWNYDEYPDQGLKSYYEGKVRKIYESLGFKVRLIKADGLIYNGGAFRCVTSPIPALKGF